MLKVSVLLFAHFASIYSTTSSTYNFPKNFLLGVAVSDYQTEGAWNEDGKGEGIWDHLVHYNNELILDGSTGDIACDSYHKYLEDVALLKEMGVDFYRFSISWPRILPSGLSSKINPAGIQYYNNLIDALLANGIQPMITLYHWNLPQYLQDVGGWVNPKIVKYFTEFARIAFENFGDRVKTWFTINEPRIICSFGYGDVKKAPALNASGIGDYQCAYNVLKAHASVYHLYDQKFRPSQKGRIGIVVDMFYPVAATNSSLDQEASIRHADFSVGLYIHPIFHPEGNYPKSVIERVANRSKLEGFSRSRLPNLSEEEVKFIKGTSDFLGLNHYSAELVKNVEEPPPGDPSFAADTHFEISYKSTWPGSIVDWLKIIPSAFKETLLWLHRNYNQPEIVIAENGFCDDGSLNDDDRIAYFKLYLKAMLEAIYEESVNVTAYTAWSFLDNFEWLEGLTLKFGLHHVDFKDPNRTRTPKQSAKFYKRLIETRSLEV